jgi:hypothetical protein
VAGNLPVNLLDETGQMLRRVVDAHLAPERWSDIASTLDRVDHAVRVGEKTALERELAELRWTIDDLQPTPTAYGIPPLPPASSPQKGRRRWALWAILVLCAVLIAPAALFLLDSEPPTTASPSDDPSVVDPATNSLWIAGALVTLAVAVVAVAVTINVVRGRRRFPSAPEPVVARRPVIGPPRVMPAPAQVREQANRTIMSLAAHGGRQ